MNFPAGRRVTGKHDGRNAHLSGHHRPNANLTRELAVHPKVLNAKEKGMRKDAAFSASHGVLAHKNDGAEG